MNALNPRLVCDGHEFCECVELRKEASMRVLILIPLIVALFRTCAVAEALKPTLVNINLAVNSSFEDGVVAGPNSWTVTGDGAWVKLARTGDRAIGSRAAPGATWRSAVVKAEDGQSYRANGWIACRSNTAILGFDLLDKDNKVLATAKGPALKPAKGWAFTAVEADAPAGTAGLRVWFSTTGEAYLDDVVTAAMVVEQLFNPTFSPNSRGGVTFWDDALTDGLEGTPRGKLSCDPIGGRNGSSALLVSAPEGWFAARNLESAFPMLDDGLMVFKFTGYSKATSGQAPLFIGWMDRQARMIRKDAIGAGAAAKDGWMFRDAVVVRPQEAFAIKPLAMAQNGEVLYDDFSLRAVEPVKNIRHLARVHVNQVGYEAQGAKSLVVATNFYPTDSNQGTIEIVSDSGEVLFSAALLCGGRVHDGEASDWGYYFWRADFSSLSAPGRYRAVATIGGTRGESYPFEIGDGLLMNRLADLGVEFFFVQRCGFDVPGWHKACHLDCALTPDGRTHFDAVGGWHSAGDYNKLMYENGDGGCSYSLLTAYLTMPDAFSGKDRNDDGILDVIDEALWGGAFVAKMINPATGGLYRDVMQGPGRNWTKWSPPEEHTDNIIGTADDPIINNADGEGSSPLAIGAWARMSEILKKRNIENDYLDTAARYFDHLTKGGTETGSPHVMLSSMDMHTVTGEQRYLDFARASVENILDGQVVTGRLKGAFGDFGEWNAAAIAVFGLTYPADPLTPRIKRALDDWVEFALTTADNPFGLSKQSVSLDPAKDYFFNPSYVLGMNFLQLGRAWAGGLIYRLTGDQRALHFGADQIDWVMGKNPHSLCMVEGAGSLNPNWYHHRYSTIPGKERGAVPGAVPNGMVINLVGLDIPGFDVSWPSAGDEGIMRRDRPSFRTSEPWLVHNMHLLLALSGLSSASPPVE
jgi:hypothetical protein